MTRGGRPGRWTWACGSPTALVRLLPVPAHADQTEDALRLLDKANAAAALPMLDEMAVGVDETTQEETSLIAEDTANLQTLYGEWQRLSDAERNDLYRRGDEIYREHEALTAVAEEKEEAIEEYAADNVDACPTMDPGSPGSTCSSLSP